MYCKEPVRPARNKLRKTVSLDCPDSRTTPPILVPASSPKVTLKNQLGPLISEHRKLTTTPVVFVKSNSVVPEGNNNVRHQQQKPVKPQAPSPPKTSKQQKSSSRKPDNPVQSRRNKDSGKNRTRRDCFVDKQKVGKSSGNVVIISNSTGNSAAEAKQLKVNDQNKSSFHNEMSKTTKARNEVVLKEHEEHQKGAVRKTTVAVAPQLKQPVNPPTAGTIVDDVLYITRPLTNADKRVKKGGDKSVMFPLISHDQFKPQKVKVPKQNHGLTVESSSSQQPPARYFDEGSRPRHEGQDSRKNSLQHQHSNEGMQEVNNGKVTEAEDIMFRLEQAIAKGNHKEAALLAKEVSKLQISTKLSHRELSEKRKKELKVEKINLNMYVEDRTSYNGPIPVKVNPTITVAELKEHVQCEYEFPVGVQRWILGKSLAEDDQSMLSSHGITKNGQTIYLYLVAPPEQPVVAAAETKAENKEEQIQDQGIGVATNGTHRKGRYWNYEMDRWSYCSSDEDSEAEAKANPVLGKPPATGAAKNDLDDNDDIEDDDYEWEYFYEGVELKQPPAQPVNPDQGKPHTAAAKPAKPETAVAKPAKAETAAAKPAKAETAAAKPAKPETAAAKPAQPETTAAKPAKPETIATKPAKSESAPAKPEINNKDEPAQKAAARPSGKTQRVDPRDGWECPTCTLLNEPTRPGCEACTTERPVDYQVPPPGPADTMPRAANKEPAAAAAAAVAAPVEVNKEKEDILKNYKKLDDLDIIPNVEAFECIVCMLDIEPGDGVVLRECLHTFCKECLSGAIEHSDAPQVLCPYKDDKYSCDMTLLEREIKALVSSVVFEKHQQKSLKEAQVTAKNSFHCKTPDCQGWCFITDNLNSFKCPLCKRLNCITCQAIHEGQDCKQYQRATLNESQDENSIKTKQWIEGLIEAGEALNCPSCQVILLKKWGCDWVRCTYCRTEICWVTKQLRWGPNGRGDTSAGCKCMADGRTKCHPLCNYCH